MPEAKQILNEEEEDFQNLKDREQTVARRQFSKVLKGQGGPQPHKPVENCSCGSCLAAGAEKAMISASQALNEEAGALESEKKKPGRPAKTE